MLCWFSKVVSSFIIYLVQFLIFPFLGVKICVLIIDCIIIVNTDNQISSFTKKYSQAIQYTYTLAVEAIALWLQKSYEHSWDPAHFTEVITCKVHWPGEIYKKCVLSKDIWGPKRFIICLTGISSLYCAF